MGEIWALAIKDLRVITHDKAAVFFLFFFPIAIAVFFSVIFSGAGGEGPRDMKIAVVDEDNTAGSQAFVKSLGDEEGITLEPRSLEDAQTAVRRGWVAAYILLPEGYGETQGGMFWGRSSGLKMGMDPSRQAEGAMLKGLLMKHSFAGMQEQFRDRTKLREQFDEYIGQVQEEAEEHEDAAQWLPFLTLMSQAFENMPERNEQTEGGESEFDFSQAMQVEVQSVSPEPEKGKAPQKSYQTSFPQGMIWGFLGSAAAFGISLVTERVRGTLTRLRIAPLSRAHILAGKGLACFMAMMSVMIALVAIGVLGFGMQPNSFVKLAMAILCSCVCFVGMMMFVSVLGKTEQSAGGFGWAIMVTLAMIGGGSLPLFLMPPTLQKISNISPVKWCTLSLEGAIWRDFSYAEMLMPCAILVTVGVVFFFVGARAFRWIQE